MGIPVRALLREKGTPYAELGLDDPKWTDDQLIDQMLAHPILINRPIVVTPKGVKLCRPSEAVLDILPNPHIGRFVKEDGEVVDVPLKPKPELTGQHPGDAQLAAGQPGQRRRPGVSLKKSFGLRPCIRAT